MVDILQSETQRLVVVQPLLHQVAHLLGQGSVGLLLADDVVRTPEGRPERVVVDVQEHEVVAHDVLLRLRVLLHELRREFYVVRNPSPVHHIR